MPVTVDSFLWEATGFNASGTSVVVTHPDAGGTTAGTTVVVLLYATGTLSVIPSGFDSVGPVSTSLALVKSNVGAGETSWTFTLTTGSANAWYMVELDDVSLADPYDGHNSGSATISNGGTRSTNTTPQNAGSSGVALAMLACVKAGSGDVQSWSGYTNSFTERVDASPAGVAGRQIAVAYKLYEGWSTYETTATFATTAASASTTGMILLLRSADASINAPLLFHTGFEFGTHGGMGNATTGPMAGVAAVGTFGTDYQVTSSAARNGGYGLRLTTSASAANVSIPTLLYGALAFGCNIRVVSATGTPTVVSIPTSGQDLFLLYDVATSKFGLKWSSGSTVWQAGTTAVNTWAWVDIRGKMLGATWHADWTVEGDGAQTAPTDPAGALVTAVDVMLGASGTQTAVFDFDDLVVSRYYGAYPLGPQVVRLLVPETTGATVSGTASNFNRFTANGTLAAVSGTEGALLDEVPPTVSASSDGVVQVAVAASDYLNLPMTTYTLASDEVIAAVRFLASLWGGTGSGTGTLGWRGHDGTTETVLVAAGTSYDADSLTAISATYPRWDTAVWSGAWTQTKLSAAAIRMGFSTDATPDMGASAVYLEVAIRAAPTVRTLTIEDPISATADLIVNPYNSATVSYVITNNDATQTAQFDYSISGTPQTPVTVGPSSSTTVDIHADAFGDVSDIALTAS